MPAPCTNLPGQQRDWRPAGSAAALSLSPEEGKKTNNKARKQRGARPDVDPRPERVRASLGPPAATTVRISDQGKSRHVSEPHALKVDERLRLARKRREEHLKQLASRERGWLAREERARRCYEQHLEERRRKLEEHRQREERRRVAVEDKRRQRLKEERERYESVVRRTMEQSQRAKQRVGNCSPRGGSGARSSTNAKRRSLSRWELDLVSRLQTPTFSYLARSRSAICLSKGEASCHSVSSGPRQKPRQGYSAPAHMGVTRPGVTIPSIKVSRVNNSSNVDPRKTSPNVTVSKMNNNNVTVSKMNNPNVTVSKMNNPNVTVSKMNNPNVTVSKMNNNNVTVSKMNNPNVAVSKMNNPGNVGQEVNSSSIEGPVVNYSIIMGPGVNRGSIESSGVNNPTLAGPGVNNPTTQGPGVNRGSIEDPGENRPGQRASSKDQLRGSNGNLEKTEWKKPQSHTSTVGATSTTATVMQDKTTPSSTGHVTDKPSIRGPLRQAPPRPESLPPLLEEEDPEAECLPECSTQHDGSSGLCSRGAGGQGGQNHAVLGLPEPVRAWPSSPEACPQKASELSLIGAGSQGRPSAGTTDPEQASRLLAEKRRQARLQRERAEEQRRQVEEAERRGRDELACRLRAERKQKEEEEQKKSAEEEDEDVDAQRQSEEEERLQLQREVEEARQKAVAEQQRLERESRFQREEAERQERKKRLEEIMKRTRKTDAAEKKPASSSTTVKHIHPNENTEPILSLPLEDVIRLPGPTKVPKIGRGNEEDLLPAVAFKERRSLRTLAGLEDIQAHQQAEVI